MKFIRVFSFENFSLKPKWSLLLFCFLILSVSVSAQVSSTNGNFTATTPSNLSLQTGATPNTRLTILQSNGNVGINTTSPADWLHVNGNVRATQLNITGGTLNTIGATTNMSFNINGTNRMTLLSGGNLGIGTATPADLLHVNGNARASQYNVVNGILNGLGTTNLLFNTNGTTRMTILGSGTNVGFVGIGLSTPEAKLHIKDGNLVMDNSLAGGNPSIYTGSGTTELNRYLQLVNSIGLANASGLKAGGVLVADTYSYANPGKNDLIVKGNVGIGIANPFAKLHVKGTLAEKGLYVETNNSWIGYSDGHNYFRGNTYLADTDVNNKVGIGTLTPAYKLDVAGTINATNILVNGQSLTSAASQWATGTGNISYATGNVGVGTTSPGARLDVQGIGTTQATNAFRVANGSGVETFHIADNGDIEFKSPNFTGIGYIRQTGNNTTVIGGGPSTENITFGPSNRIFLNAADVNANMIGLQTLYGVNLTNGNSLNLQSYINVPAAGQTAAGVAMLGTANNQTTGTAKFLDFQTSINLSNNATNATVYGVDYNPTLTNTTGLGTHLAWRNTSGNVLIGGSSITPATRVDIRGEGNTSATTALRVANSLNSELFIIRSDGNVGIGTTPNAAYKLDVAGTINATNILVNGQPISGGTSQWATNVSNISYSAGNVGIGTTNPSSKLEVLGQTITGIKQNGTVNDYEALSVYNTTASNIASGNGAIIQFYNNASNGNTNGGNVIYGASVKSVSSNDQYGWESDLYLRTTKNNSYASQTTLNALVIKGGTGNIGIGTSSPNAKLTVKGSGAGGAGGLKVINTNEVYPTWGLVISQEDNLTGSINSNGRDLQIQPGWDKTLILGSNEMQANGGKVIFPGGNVGIGTATPDAKLAVKGTIHTNEVKVDLNGAVAPDYVFEKDYHLMSLEETKAYIDANKHLPEVPSAKEMEKNGVQLGEMNLLLLKKVEELTLHLIEQQKTNQDQARKITELENKILKIMDK